MDRCSLVSPSSANGLFNLRPSESSGYVDLPSTSRVTPSSNPSQLASIRNFTPYQGKFSPAVSRVLKASIAKSTEDNYSRYFNRFLNFLTEIDVPFERCTLNDVLEFLVHFVEALSFSSVKSAAAAIHYYCDRLGKTGIFDDKAYSDFLKGARRLCPIPRKDIQIWDATQVLRLIAASPVPSDFFSAAKEASILLALATGFRVDCLTKLGFEVISSTGHSVYPFIDLRKCPIRGVYTSSQAVSDFISIPRICPNAAVFRFLCFASVFRAKDPYLFVSSRGYRAAHATVRRWICLILLEAGIVATAGTTRSASSSLAAFLGVSTDKILSSAGWSSESVWRRHYHRPIKHVSFNLFSALEGSLL